MLVFALREISFGSGPCFAFSRYARGLLSEAPHIGRYLHVLQGFVVIFAVMRTPETMPQAHKQRRHLATSSSSLLRTKAKVKLIALKATNARIVFFHAYLSLPQSRTGVLFINLRSNSNSRSICAGPVNTTVDTLQHGPIKRKKLPQRAGK